jgi:hypothetical protein
MHSYTEFCTSELRQCLRAECADFEWASGETNIQGKEFRTQIDVSGERDNLVILVQFEMHRSNVSSNTLKMAYCLDNDRSFKGKEILILHVFSPFYEQPKPDPLQQGETNEHARFERYIEGKETRELARRNAYKEKLLCLFLEEKRALHDATTTYKVVEWKLDNRPQVRHAAIVLPEKPFPEDTKEAVASLAKQLGREIRTWQNR